MTISGSSRIVVSRTVLHGKPHIAGTRIGVVQILDLLAAGKTPAEIVSDDYYPELTEPDIRACLAYASQALASDQIIPTV